MLFIGLTYLSTAGSVFAVTPGSIKIGRGGSIYYGILILTPTKFGDFVRGEQIDTQEKLETYQKMYEQKQQQRSQWITELGLQAGPNLMQLPLDAKGYRMGYSAGVVVSFTKRRLQLRPGINLSSKGGSLPTGEKLSITYIEVPAQISYTIIKRAFLHLPGGIRIHVAPYSALALQENENERQLNKLDYGVKIGLSFFIGETSNMEVGVGYNLGIGNITKTENSNLITRGYYLSCSFIF